MTRPDRPGCPGRVVHRYSRWPLKPVEDLLTLRYALLRVQKPARPGAGDELLDLVDQEVRRRGLIPPAGNRSGVRSGAE